MFIITKAWKSEPALRQSAILKPLHTREEAENKIKELEKDFPDRVFEILELNTKK